MMAVVPCSMTVPLCLPAADVNDVDDVSDDDAEMVIRVPDDDNEAGVDKMPPTMRRGAPLTLEGVHAYADVNAQARAVHL